MSCHERSRVVGHDSLARLSLNLDPPHQERTWVIFTPAFGDFM